MSENTTEKSLRRQLAIFPSRSSAERAIHALMKAGFDEGDISLFVHVPVGDEARGTAGSSADRAIDVGGATGAEFGGEAGGIGGLLVQWLIRMVQGFRRVFQRSRRLLRSRRTAWNFYCEP